MVSACAQFNSPIGLHTLEQVQFTESAPRRGLWTQSLAKIIRLWHFSVSKAMKRCVPISSFEHP
jgi:hypothetical protein